MKNNNTVLFLAIAIILATILFSCKSTKSEPLVDGVYITSIEGDIIKTDEGEYKIETVPGDKMYYLIRHAEKDTVPKDNPNLTQEGLDRANFLAELMKGTRLDAIYSTMYTRTLFTVDTLAARKGLKLELYRPAQLMKLYKTIQSDSTVQSVLVVGHSNTTPAFANIILRNQEFEQGFDESDYDNFLIVIERADGNNIVHKLRFRPR